MSKDLIRYDLLAQEALRGVVRKVLADVARLGLPGDHHFYVEFATGYPGVRMSQRLRESYPQTMTIILQHQFWDLAVTEHAFEVGLSFTGVPERLLVPFDAIVQFFDPSANFGLKFETAEPAASAEAPAPTPLRPVPVAPVAAVPSPEKTPRTRTPKGAGSEPSAVPPAEPGPSPVPRVKPAPKPAAVAAPPASEDPPEPPKGGGAEVVSLDKFRKK